MVTLHVILLRDILEQLKKEAIYDDVIRGNDMIRGTVITMIMFVVSINADPLLLLSSQLDQLQQAAYVPSKKMQELIFSPVSSVARNAELFPGWLRDVHQYIKGLKDAVVKKNELNSILSTQKNNVIAVVSRTLDELSREKDSQKLVVSINASDIILKTLGDLSKLCHENNLGDACKWITEKYGWFASKIEPLQGKTSDELARLIIYNNFMNWRNWAERWFSRQGDFNLKIAGKKFDPDKISDEQAAEIYAACSWEGLAHMLGIQEKHNIQYLVAVKLEWVMKAQSHKNTEEIVEDIIIGNLERLVISLGAFYSSEKVVKEGKEFIEQVKTWDAETVLNSMGTIALVSQAKLNQKNVDFKTMKSKYDALIKFFKQSDLWKEYSGNIDRAWCEVVLWTAFITFETLLKEIIKKAPGVVSNMVSEDSWEKTYKSLVGGRLKQDWDAYKECSFMKNFNIKDFFQSTLKDIEKAKVQR
jgi:hypothetical protein